MNHRLIGLLSILLSLAVSGLAHAQPPPGGSVDASALARRWDHINFELKDSQVVQSEASQLEQQAAALAKADPHDPQPLIWEALALLAKADARRNLTSLPLADRARHLLEKAADMGVSGDDAGFTYAVLGTLYSEMPGFPLGFGDRKKAGVLFAKATAAAPDDIDVNVLHADYLMHQRDYPGAITAAKRALAARPQPDREIRDRYRRDEAQTLLAQAQQKAGAGSP